MFYVRAILAILFGVLGLVPMLLAAGCWLVALRAWPGSARAKSHADTILATLARLSSRHPAPPPPGPVIPGANIPPEAWGEVHVTAGRPDWTPERVRLDLDRNDLGPLAKKRRQPTIMERQCADAAEATGRTLIRLDDDSAVLGPMGDPRLRH